MNRIEELVLRLLDQSISDDELIELSELSEADEQRSVAIELIELEATLHSAGRSSICDQVVSKIEQDRCGRVEAGVMDAVAGRATPAGDDSQVRQSTARNVVLGVCAVGVLAACVLLFLSVDWRDTANDAIAQLIPHGSGILVLDAEGERRNLPADHPYALKPDETIEVSQATDFAEIAYPDGTRLEILGEARVQISVALAGEKQIVVTSGVVQADVAPQPEGRPLRIVTRTATLEVLGTSLGVEVQNDLTQLGVSTGRVAMTRTADGQRVEVEAGRFATATEWTDEPLTAHPFPQLAEGWSEDFEEGLPNGWRGGELIEVGSQSPRHAVSARRSRSGRYVITSHNAWQEGDHGLCSIDGDSVMHLRIRQSEFARITIMIGTRSYPPSPGRTGSNLFYTKRAWNENLEAGTWKTISIPLQNVGWHVKQGTRINGSPELKGLVAYLVHVSTMERDAGLEIERVWITKESEESQP